MAKGSTGMSNSAATWATCNTHSQHATHKWQKHKQQQHRGAGIALLHFAWN